MIDTDAAHFGYCCHWNHSSEIWLHQFIDSGDSFWGDENKRLDRFIFDLLSLTDLRIIFCFRNLRMAIVQNQQIIKFNVEVKYSNALIK